MLISSYANCQITLLDDMSGSWDRAFWLLGICDSLYKCFMFFPGFHCACNQSLPLFLGCRLTTCYCYCCWQCWIVGDFDMKIGDKQNYGPEKLLRSYRLLCEVIQHRMELVYSYRRLLSL